MMYLYKGERNGPIQTHPAIRGGGDRLRGGGPAGRLRGLPAHFPMVHTA